MTEVEFRWSLEEHRIWMELKRGGFEVKEEAEYVSSGCGGEVRTLWGESEKYS